MGCTPYYGAKSIAFTTSNGKAMATILKGAAAPAVKKHAPPPRPKKRGRK